MNSSATIGPFRDLKLIGSGGMATVYKAYEPDLDRHVALKVLPGMGFHTPELAKRFLREARIIARLEHVHVVPVYRYGIDGGSPWISMRLLPGQDLTSLGQLPPGQAVEILTQVAEALDYAHAEKVIHRDVKPSNILLDNDKRAYLADFGLARIGDIGSGLTKPGRRIGTAGFMAPELWESKRSDQVDHRVDIYALGIVAYQLLTGVVPFTGDEASVRRQHLYEPIPVAPLKLVASGCVQPVVTALAKAPANRWASASEFVADLRRGLFEVPPDPPRGAPDPSPPPDALDWRKAIAVTLVVGSITSGALWWTLNRDPSPVPATPSAKPGMAPLPEYRGWKPPPIRVGGNIQPPTKIIDVPPTYPPLARTARASGVVILEAVIGPDGRVTDVQVLRSVALLDEAAIDAVRQWVYTPTMLNGVPVPVIMTVTVNFQLR